MTGIAPRTGRVPSPAGAGEGKGNAVIVSLLRESLAAWRIPGEVRVAGDAILLTAAGQEIRIEPPPPGLGFRWIVVTVERRRAVSSIAGLLRTVRGALDPGYRAARLRLAPLPALPDLAPSAPQ